jgi:UDP-galactopyranose mutase
VQMYDWIVVGAGFAGSVLAERLASVRGDTVLVIDKRSHIAGNAFDEINADGLMVHRYGPHIFHTNSQMIFEYLSRFTSWRPYEHRVLASVDGQLLPIPINLDTINRLYGLSLTSAELEDWFAERAEHIDPVRTSEDVVVNRVGRELFEKFFEGYTTKQWGIPPSALDKSVTARVPVRTDRDDRYFSDTYQCMPADGYTEMFQRLLAHPNITVQLSTEFSQVRDTLPARRTIFTGPIDEYYDHRFGKLPYRSLKFQHVTLDQERHQPVAVVNYPQDRAYTRITEYKYLTGQEHPKTSLTYEFPCDEGDPYYPIPRAQNEQLFKMYQGLSQGATDLWFAGRLGSYRYYNMDQVVGQALATFDKIHAAVPVSKNDAATLGAQAAE